MGRWVPVSIRRPARYPPFKSKGANNDRIASRPGPIVPQPVTQLAQTLPLQLSCAKKTSPRVIPPVTEPSHAVFLSYASQDAQAAQKICEALRVAGIEVWFDQSELRGGDAWDQSIRKQIKTCSLFLPVISHTTHDRVEGYFRLEWKLGIDRSHLISADQAFLLPVVIDDTRDDDERVPERFREVQWTRLPGEIGRAHV